VRKQKTLSCKKISSEKKVSENKIFAFSETIINIIFHKKATKTPEPLLRGKNQKSTNL